MTRTRIMQLAGVCVAAVAVTVLGGGQAKAASTTVNSPSFNEHNHQQILGNLYGGSFTADGNDYKNGTVTAQRVDDDLDQVISLSTQVSARVRAVFAGLDQSFGYLPGSSGSTDDYVELIDVSGKRYNATGSNSPIDLTGEGEFRWARKGSNGVMSSKNSDNPSADDHLVTYTINGLPDASEPSYLLLFEDLYGSNSDNDYNDLVVEVSSIAHAPTPGAVGSGLMLLGLVGFARHRRRRRA